MIKNKRILILGGAGFIGFHRAKKLEKQGFYIDLVDDLSRGKIDSDFKNLLKNIANKVPILDEKLCLIYCLADFFNPV